MSPKESTRKLASRYKLEPLTAVVKLENKCVAISAGNKIGTSLVVIFTAFNRLMARIAALSPMVFGVDS